VCAEAIDCVLGITIPFYCGVESIGAIIIPCLDGGFSANGVVGGGGKSCSSLRTWIEANLTDDVEGDGTFDEFDGVVTVVGQATGGLVCHNSQCLTGVAKYVYRARRQRA
jgi:hypothetical protein